MNSIADNLALPRNYPLDWVVDARLNDSTQVTIRPIRPDDAPCLQWSFKKLSPESIYMRFLETFNELTDERAHYYANVDYGNRMALVGTITEGHDEVIIGVSRYDMVGDERPGMAECAVIVLDDYHGLGMGTILMSTLIDYASQHGVTHFIGTIHLSNTRIKEIIKESGYSYERRMISPGVWEVRVGLVEDA